MLILTWHLYAESEIKVYYYYYTYANDQEVHEAVDVRAFEARLATVHHELRVSPREYDEPVAPLGVAQDAASQEDLIVVDGERLILPLHDALELTQLVVGRFAHDRRCNQANT